MKRIFSKLNLVLDLLFPRKCVNCGKSGNNICEDCFKTIELLKNQFCPACNKENLNGIFCNETCKKGFHIDQLIVCSGYRQSAILKKLIWLLKYKFSKEIASLLGKLMKFQFARFSHEREFLVSAVPLSKSRQKERGFNQAQLLADYLVKSFSNLLLANCLTRKIDFQHQAKLGQIERIKNVTGTFAIKKDFLQMIEGKSFLMIDDVATTCSTLNECAKTLKEAGANYVCGLVIARATLIKDKKKSPLANFKDDYAGFGQLY